MTTRRSVVFMVPALAALLVGGCLIFLARPAGPAQAITGFPTTRDARQWPFAWNSIWNLPLGDEAQLVPAGIPAAAAWGMTVDEDVLVLEPTAPSRNVVYNDAGWDFGRTRCGSAQASNVILSDIPIPDSFSTLGYLGNTPNMAAALLSADGDTLVQTQPFHRCGAGGLATSQYVFPQDSLRNGTGIAGAHGGSAMSSLGGTVRLGELVPGGTIRHALKVNINCAVLCSYASNEADGKLGYRWPARAADSSASTRYQGSNPSVQMGSLLALPPSFNEAALRTEPARIMARAMRDYGAYVVDDTGWDVYALTTEWSPQGRVIDEFALRWGFPLESGQLSGCTQNNDECGWSKDMATLFADLKVVEDNSATNIGGAGTRRQPCAPAYADGTGGAPASCSPVDASLPPASAPATTAAPPTTAAPTTTTASTSTTTTTASTTTTTTTASPPTSSATPPPPTAQVLNGEVLRVSSRTRRSPSEALQGANWLESRRMYIFLAPASPAGSSSVQQVRFWVDDPYRVGNPRRTEVSAPWDLAGGSTRTALAYRAPSKGTHVITAEVHRTDGTVVVLHAAFTVR